MQKWIDWPPRFRESVRQNGWARGLTWVAFTIFFYACCVVPLVLIEICKFVPVAVKNLIIDPLNPWSGFHRSRREEKRRDKELDIIVNANGPAVVTPQSIATAIALSPPPTNYFFGRLPYEIRRQIQLLAFGGRTLHMSLDFGPPERTSDRHAPPLYPRSSEDDKAVASKARKEWAWSSCICRRSAAEDRRRTLSHGRLRCWPMMPGADADLCLKGEAFCSWWPGDCPDNCCIGISSWMRTCRQAYVEASTIFYAENTITISSAPLLRGFQDVVSPNLTSSLTSLEIPWSSNNIRLNVRIQDAFKGYARSETDTRPAPLFPSLVHLRICFHSIDPWSMDGPMGHMSQQELHDWLAHSLPTRLDNLTRTIAPPTAEIYVSQKKWFMYKALDLALIMEHGLEVAQPQICKEYGGLKCWRQMPLPESANDPGRPDDQNIGEDRGYWFHVTGDTVTSEPRIIEDLDHQRLYNLRAYAGTNLLPKWKTIEETDPRWTDVGNDLP